VAGSEPTVALDAVLERTGLHAWLAQAGRPAAEEIATLRTLAAQEGDVGALQHVALTRPRTRLYLSAAGEPASPDAAGCPSRFLALIPPELLQVA
jgi:hypothetical protein